MEEAEGGIEAVCDEGAVVVCVLDLWSNYGVSMYVE